MQKLLASKNAEDLRAANRLIRDMVRRDEKRMQKLQQRLEDVELIQNNVKLLNELLSHWKDTSGDTERQLIDVRRLVGVIMSVCVCVCVICTCWGGEEGAGYIIMLMIPSSSPIILQINSLHWLCILLETIGLNIFNYLIT